MCLPQTSYGFNKEESCKFKQVVTGDKVSISSISCRNIFKDLFLHNSAFLENIVERKVKGNEDKGDDESVTTASFTHTHTHVPFHPDASPW